MDFDKFQKEFFTKLKIKSKQCLKIIDNNKALIQEYLGNNANPQTLKKFVDDINDIILFNSSLITIIIDSDIGINPFNSKYDLIEKALNHPSFHKVLETFKNSDVLIRACRIGNKNATKWLLTMNVNPYLQDENGVSAMMYATQQNFDFVVRPFFHDSLCMNLADKNGENILFYSVRNPEFFIEDGVVNTRYLNELINTSKININHTNRNGESVLIYCAKNDILEPICKYLLRNDFIDVNIVDNNGKTAAMYLAENGHCPELMELQKKNCNYRYMDINGESVMSIVINKMYSQKDPEFVHYGNYGNYVSIMRAFVKNQFDFNYPIDNDDNTPFMVMVIVNDVASAKFCAHYLKKLDLSVKNRYGESVTSLCYKLDHYELLPFFKKNPTFDYNYRDPLNQNTLLMISAINNPSAMKDLLENDPGIINEVNVKNENALIIASKINNIKAAEILLKRGIDVNHQDNLGNTALHYAVEIQSPYLVYKLMSKKPDIYIKNNEGKSALDLARKITDDKMEILNMLQNPSYNIKRIKFINSINFKYMHEIMIYTIPSANNNYPEYKSSEDMELIKREIYGINNSDDFFSYIFKPLLFIIPIILFVSILFFFL